MEKQLKVRYSTTQPNAYEVYYEGGGEVPSYFNGVYTSPGVAEKAITTYETLGLRRTPKKKGSNVNDKV